MEFSLTSDKDAKFLEDRGADPLKVYGWRLACETGVYKSLKEAIQAGLKLTEKD